MNLPQQQQQQQQLPTVQVENNNSDEDDYDYFLQVLDAGEHMYGMFVADDEDLYAYLSSEHEQSSVSSWIVPATEDTDTEDTMSTGIAGGGEDDYHHHPRASFADMHILGKLPASGEARCCANSDGAGDDGATNRGRITPTQNVDEDHHAMIE